MPSGHEFGFDKPLIVQYVDYVRRACSTATSARRTRCKPVTTVIGAAGWGRRLAHARRRLVVAWVIARRRDAADRRRRRVTARLGSGLEMFTAGLPHYWLGVILLVVFAIELRIFPVIGGTSAWGTGAARR